VGSSLRGGVSQGTGWGGRASCPGGRSRLTSCRNPNLMPRGCSCIGVLPSTNQKLIKKVMCPNGVTCVKPMTHHYESFAKYINHMTTIVRHVKISSNHNKLITHYCVVM